MVVGALILGALAHVTVIATGGYGTPHSYLTIAIAIGVACASPFSAMAWSAGWRKLAVWLVITIICGEGYNIFATAERLVAGREALQAPLRKGIDDYAKAVKRVKDAERAVDRAPTTSDSLQQAQATKAVADAAVIQNSAARGCRENCRQLLQAQVDEAVREVAAAQAALVAQRDRAEGELTAARTALANTKPPQSPTPLADRLGIAAWIIDLLTSALGSVAANGLAAGLLIFGAHHRTRRVEVVTPLPVESIVEPVVPTIEQLSPRKPRTARPRGNGKSKGTAIAQHTAKFAVECLKPGGEADLLAIRDRYGTWCPVERRLPPAKIGQALAKLFSQTGIAIADRNGRLVAIGVSLKLAADNTIDELGKLNAFLNPRA
jgi:hypothetical protein